MSQTTLLRHRRFGPFFWTQLLGALNDNLFKNALVILATFGVAARNGVSTSMVVNLAGGVFILPFFLFSATAGQLADKYDKDRIIRAVKVFEIGVMTIGAAGLLAGHLPTLLFALFLMGVHSTVFGPVKYGILPQHLHEDELVGGNALVEMATFVAILLGTVLGGILSAHVAAGAVLVIAVAGWLTSRGVPVAPASDPSLRIRWNPITETARVIGYVREVHSVLLSVLGISWFWFYGALVVAQLPELGSEILGANAQATALVLTAFSFGIGLGCLLCERMSGDVIELGLVPLGAFGLTAFAVDLFFATHAAEPPPVALGVRELLASSLYWHVAIDLMLLGIFGGFYIVPLLAFVQHRTRPALRARVIAGNNVVNAFFMVLAALLGAGLRGIGWTIPQLFLLTAVLNAVVAVYIFTVVPEFLMRFLIWLLMSTVYRLQKRGLEHIPAEGPAVLVCNHVSFVDALVISAVCRRPIRFVMDHQIFKIPVLHFIFRTAKAIPIASRKENPALVERAFDTVATVLAEGELVGIFPEGRLTGDGEMSPFRPGVERILERTPVPVVPMALRGLWGGFFSRVDGAAMRHPFRRVWSRIELVCDPPLPPDEATAAVLEARVRALRGDWR